MHYKLRLWCSSLYLMLSALRLTPLGIRRNGDTPLTPFLVFRTPGILFTGCPYPVLRLVFQGLDILFFLSI